MGLWIFLGVLFFVCLVFVLPIRICVKYADELRITLSVFGLRFQLYPKKKKVRLRDYSLKKLRKRRKKAARKEQLKKEKQKRKAASHAADQKKTVKAHIRTLKLILVFLKKIQLRLRNGVSIGIKSLDLRVATGDAASTAILYGVLSGIVAQLLAVSDLFLKTTHRIDKIHVVPDYCAEETTVRVKIVLSSNLWKLLRVALTALIAFINTKTEPNQNNTTKMEEKNNGKRKPL